MRNVKTVLILGTILMFVVAPAAATVDTFWISLGDASGGGAMGEFLGGDCTGYDGNDDGVGDWTLMYFTSGGLSPYSFGTGWYVQWFYDHPYDDTRWKEIVIDIEVTENAYCDSHMLEVMVDWSLPDWSPNDTAPPYDENFMGAEPLILWESISGTETFHWEITIPDYNPEWVSIDIWGQGVDISGTIEHNCVPEPATMVLLGIGGIGVLIRRRRK